MEGRISNTYDNPVPSLDSDVEEGLTTKAYALS